MSSISYAGSKSSARECVIGRDWGETTQRQYGGSCGRNSSSSSRSVIQLSSHFWQRGRNKVYKVDNITNASTIDLYVDIGFPLYLGLLWRSYSKHASKWSPLFTSLLWTSCLAIECSQTTLDLYSARVLISQVWNSRSKWTCPCWVTNKISISLTLDTCV